MSILPPAPGGPTVAPTRGDAFSWGGVVSAFILGALLSGIIVSLTLGKTAPVKPRADRVIAAILEAKGAGCAVQTLSGSVPIAQKSVFLREGQAAEANAKAQGATFTKLVVTHDRDNRMAIGVLYAEACPTAPA